MEAANEKFHWVMTEVTFGHIWGVDLVKNEAIIKDVILVAQGRMNLEVCISQTGEDACLVTKCI